MPIYEYECLKNKHRFEVIQKFSDTSVEKCTICGEPVRRLLSAPAIQFKGSGFYINDYARRDNSSSDTSEKSSTAADKPSSGDKSSAAEKSASGDKPSTEASASTESKSEKSAPAPAATSDKKES